jgi:hypothetical protein
VLTNPPIQAQLQGVQSRHTKINLVKQPDLFQRFRDTPCRGGHRYSIQSTKTKGEHITGSLPLCWQTNIFCYDQHTSPPNNKAPTFVSAFVPHLRELSNQEIEELSLIYKLKPVICLTKTAFV